MISSKTILNNFYNDIVIVTFSMLIFIVVITILSMIINGNSNNGMNNGIYWGLGLGIATFYYLRSQFSLIPSIIQALINIIFTVSQFMGLRLLLDQADFSKISSDYLLIIIFIPIFLSINKQILDYITIKFNGQKRNKKPIEMT